MALNVSAQTLVETDLLEALGLSSLPEEKQEALIEQVLKLVQARVINRVDELIKPEDRTEWQQLLAGEDEAALTKFLEGRGIGFTALVLEESYALKAELLGGESGVK